MARRSTGSAGRRAGERSPPPDRRRAPRSRWPCQSRAIDSRCGRSSRPEAGSAAGPEAEPPGSGRPACALVVQVSAHPPDVGLGGLPHVASREGEHGRRRAAPAGRAGCEQARESIGGPPGTAQGRRRETFSTGTNDPLSAWTVRQLPGGRLRAWTATATPRPAAPVPEHLPPPAGTARARRADAAAPAHRVDHRARPSRCRTGLATILAAWAAEVVAEEQGR